MKATIWLALTCCLVCGSARVAPAAEEPPSSSTGLTLHAFPSADLEIEGFPVWLGSDRKLDRLVVLVEGFDLFNRKSARDLLRMVSPVADRLAAVGVDAMVVDFPDSHLPPNELAPLIGRAARAGAAATGRDVAVAALSAGGIAARWALTEAEEAGRPLPVHTLLLFDTPNRGARMSPTLQALVGRYGTRDDREAIHSAAGRALFTCVPANVRWKTVGVPGMARRVPARLEADASEHLAFFERLHRLNGNRGYPKQCRIIAVAQGSRSSGPVRETAGDLLRLWLPLGHRWAAPAEADDRAPGSLMPTEVAVRWTVRKPLGLAGAYLPSAPTLITTDSALDAGALETPPFAEWYARPDGLEPIHHDDPDAGVVEFASRALIRSFEPAGAAGSGAAIAAPQPGGLPAGPTRLPAGTAVAVRLKEDVRAGRARKGGLVPFEVARDVLGDEGRVLIPQGTPVTGHVEASRGPGRFGRGGKLEVSVERATLANGAEVPLRLPTPVRVTGRNRKGLAMLVGLLAAGGAAMGLVGATFQPFSGGGAGGGEVAAAGFGGFAAGNAIIGGGRVTLRAGREFNAVVAADTAVGPARNDPGPRPER